MTVALLLFLVVDFCCYLFLHFFKPIRHLDFLVFLLYAACFVAFTQQNSYFLSAYYEVLRTLRVYDFRVIAVSLPLIVAVSGEV